MRLISVDDAFTDGPSTQHGALMQVAPDGERSTNKGWIFLGSIVRDMRRVMRPHVFRRNPVCSSKSAIFSKRKLPPLRTAFS